MRGWSPWYIRPTSSSGPRRGDDLAAVEQQHLATGAGPLEQVEASSEPAMTTALASTSATRALSATTVAWTTSVTAGRPVRGSMR